MRSIARGLPHSCAYNSSADLRLHKRTGTKVSLKQALKALGFAGGSKRESELNQWINAEKERLAAVMERHGIEWE